MKSSTRALLAMLPMALLPALSLVGHWDSFLAEALSELPVKLWAFETFGSVGIWGGQVSSISFPHAGPLNNPDPVGTLVYLALKPVMGRVWSYNTLVLLQIYAAMVSAWLLARDLVGNDRAAVVAALVYALAPLVLVYCVMGAITDMLNLWPYPLALMFLLRALRRPGWGDALKGGVIAGLGFVSCPYNFVVFSAMVVPLGLVLPFAGRAGFVPVEDPRAGVGSRHWLLVAAVAGAAVLVVAGSYVLQMERILADPSSQMSQSYIDATRHVPPYSFLRPQHEHRYVAYLSDYLAVGKGALIQREAGSLYFRAFSPGLLAMALAIYGLFRSRGRRSTVVLWTVVAIFFVLASTGPFLPLTSQIAFSNPSNYVWLALHHFLPGANLLLEPFRYALGASLGLAMAAAVGAAALMDRWGRWVGLLLPLLILAETAFLSPVPVPLHVARLEIPRAYWRLDDVLPRGAIIQLPYFDRGSERFNRVHFLYQLVHHRPIPDEVMGFPPDYLQNNQFTAALLEA